MTESQLDEPPALRSVPLFIDRPLRDRALRGAGIGLVLGVISTIVTAIWADWDLGLAFNKLDPPGNPIHFVMRLSLIGFPLAGALGAAFTPFCRRRGGAALVGLSALLPIATIALTSSPGPPSLDSWEEIVAWIALIVFAAVGGLAARPFLLRFRTLEAEFDDDRPQN